MSIAAPTIARLDRLVAPVHHESSPKRLGRTAGLLYLLVGIFGAFAIGIVYPAIYVAGDAAKTTANVVANSGLVRGAVVADLFQATVWIFLAMVLYRLLKPVNKSVASAMVVLAAIGAGITCFNVVFEFEGWRVATGAVNATALGTAGSNALVLLLLDAQHFGIFVAQVFMGLWLAPLGYLAYKSGRFPKALGVVLIVATVTYLVDVLAVLTFPDVAKGTHVVVSAVATIAEAWMVGYLLVIGARTLPEDAPAARTLS
jgi:hypothetical protein